MRYVKAIGIELEGWHFPEGLETPGWRPDASVYHDCYEHECSGHPECDNSCDAGEVATPVPSRTLTGIYRWLDETWPDGHSADCGMHVHMSFKNPGDYGSLMEPSFWQHFQDYYGDWAKDQISTSSQFWERWNGYNHFCRKEFHPLQQYMQSNKWDGPRYTQLNYRFLTYGTIECRLFPMFKNSHGGVETAKKAVKALANCYNAYLRTSKQSTFFVPFNFDSSDTDVVVDMSGTVIDAPVEHNLIRSVESE